MVMQKEGETEFTVLVHEDDMKRITMRSLKYVNLKKLQNIC